MQREAVQRCGCRIRDPPLKARRAPREASSGKLSRLNNSSSKDLKKKSIALAPLRTTNFRSERTPPRTSPSFSRMVYQERRGPLTQWRAPPPRPRRLFFFFFCSTCRNENVAYRNMRGCRFLFGDPQRRRGGGGAPTAVLWAADLE